ncbi:MAG: TraR/DksA family transcriptional regulator [Planctomycetota bacterium]|jgi:RNA polymerase-binding transcription factor DksA
MPKRQQGTENKKKSTRSKRVTAAKKSSRNKASRTSSRVRKIDFEKYRNALYEEYQRLAGVVVSIEEQSLSKSRSENSGDVGIMPLHPAEIAGDNYQQDFNLGLMETNRGKLDEVREAVKRLDDGVYGKCVECGGPIPKARLEAAPWAKYCLGCQTEFEQNGGY